MPSPRVLANLTTVSTPRILPRWENSRVRKVVPTLSSGSRQLQSRNLLEKFNNLVPTGNQDSLQCPQSVSNSNSAACARLLRLQSCPVPLSKHSPIMGISFCLTLAPFPTRSPPNHAECVVACRGEIQMRRRRGTTAPSVTMPRPKKVSVEGSGTLMILISPKRAVPPLLRLLGSVWIWR